MPRLSAAIVGGSGYTGGELLRLLLGHPEIEVTQVTSRSLAKKFVTSVHPNLRKRTTLKFIAPEELEPADLLFLGLPHGAGAARVGEWSQLAPIVIDLSADFRLRNPADYPTWYSWEHPHPDLLSQAVYGLPELHREALRQADYIASPGCTATACILAFLPMVQSGLLDPAMPMVIECKTSSSAGGSEATPASHHPERSGSMRSYKLSGHRHSAEIIQELSIDGFQPQVNFSVTSVEAVRGILATGHVFTKERVTDKDLWKFYRECYNSEPFVRIVKESGGLHRSPEPKILAGTNYCDVGFETDPFSNRVVVTSAIDNLMKGAAGQAVQAMNVRLGLDETLGLEFTGLHPV